MSKSKKQRLYKMKGCSKKKSRKYLGLKLVRGSKKIRGGEGINTVNSSNMRTNTNAANPVYPSTGPPSASQSWINSSTQRGGCGGSCGLLKGGNIIKGGNGLPFGQGLAQMKPILAPSGLTGQSWTANLGWPGTSNVSGDNNHYSLNKYEPVDISRQMQNVGAQPPFLGGGRRKYKTKTKKQRGGALSNFLYQDFVNVGRQFEFGLGSTYNALSGYNAPVNPMPWQQPGLSNNNVFKY